MLFKTDILKKKYFVLKGCYHKKFIFLLFLCYFMQKGNKERAERVLVLILFKLKKLMHKSLKPAQYTLGVESFMNTAINNCVVDFKLILNIKRKYRVLTLSDLLKEHSFLYTLKLTKISKQKSKGKRGKKSTNELDYLQLTPVIVSVNYKRLHSFLILLRGAAQQNGAPVVDKLVKELFLTFFKKSVSYKLKVEMVKLACLHKSNIHFGKRG